MDNFKIVVLDSYTMNDIGWDGLRALGEVVLYDRTSPEDVAARIGDAHAVFSNKCPITKETIDACPNLKFIGMLATGYNMIDIKAARARGIDVCNVPTYGTAAVAQMAFALLLEVCHHVGDHDKAVKAGRWASCPDFCFWDSSLIELYGKTMGIIGFGRIGQATGRIAQAMGLTVLAHDVHQSEQGMKIAHYVELDELLSKSDIICTLAPLTPDTEGIINKANIGKMKDGVIIINNSRGQLVNEQDLADALNSGKVYAAAVDVVSVEPIQPDNPLLTAKNIIITPHISWAANEARVRLMEVVVDNMKAFKDGKPINVVN